MPTHQSAASAINLVDEETGEEMAGNSEVFISGHQLMETYHRRNIELAQVDDDQMIVYPSY